MPIQVTCLHCGAAADVEDQHAGQMIACSRCGLPVPVPAKPRRFRISVVLLTSLGVLLMLALLMPKVGRPREASRRTQCWMNLRQIGVGLQAYHERYGCFPPAYIADERGTPKHSWRVLLLPFLGEGGLYEQYRFDEPWNGPHNRELAARMPRVYRCPTRPSRLYETAVESSTSYAMIVGPHAISGGASTRKISDIKDGLAGTIFVAECARMHIPWLEPRDLPADQIRSVGSYSRNLKGTFVGINSYHGDGAFVLFGNGVTALLRDDIEEKTLKAALTIDGGD
jgi:DNA-directed RNA polymerase subunit RPC12/RpoP